MPAHQLVEFLLRSGQLKDAETQLKVILEKNRTKDPKSADELAWARRTLALTLLKYENDYQQSQQALAILEPIVKAADGQGAADRTTRNPDDLRVLARAYHAQRTKVYQEKALKIFEELAEAHAIIPEDRFLLARMYNSNGDWTKAHEQYRALDGADGELARFRHHPALSRLSCAVHLGRSQSLRVWP